MLTAALWVMAAQPCEPEYRAVAPVQVELFLDPSEANRAAVTTRFVSKVLPTLRDCKLVTRIGETPGHGGGSCFRNAIESISGDVDQVILGGGLADQTDFYATCKDQPGLEDIGELLTASGLEKKILPDPRSEYPLGKGPAAVKRRGELLPGARSRCTDLSSYETCPGIGLLLATFDPLVVTNSSKLSQGTRAWIELHKAYTNRLQFLAAALDRPLSGQRTGVDDSLVLSAIREVIGDRDPRLWDPDELAVLIRSARKWNRDPMPSGQAIQNGAEVRNRLGKRIGYRRAEELVQLSPRAPSEMYPGELLRHEHFAREKLLYEREWVAKRLDPATAKLKEYEQIRGGETLGQFLVRRWRETDEAAPHPDMDRVVELVERWEREGGP